MKENLRRMITAFLIVGGISLSVFHVKGETVPAKVTFFDAYLTFEVWQGNGNVSVSIGDDFLTKGRNIVKFEEFEELQYGQSTFDVSNYTVSKVSNNTVITLKEEYLKTLKDGTYSFKAVFSKTIIPIKLHVVTCKVSLTDAYFTFTPWIGSGSVQAKLTPDTYSYTYYPELFEGLSYKGKKIGASNYAISQFQNVTTITLKEQYVTTLADGEHYFVADFMNVSVKLKLKKETVKKVPKVKKVRAISKKKKLKITWKKQKNVTGYVIKVGTNRKITKNVRTIAMKKNRNGVIVKGLKKNKKYYLKVRAYKVKNGKKYFGDWSTKISKRTK